MNDHVTITDIDVQEAARRAQSGQALLLDVREPSEWFAGRAAAAVHVPLSTLRPQDVPSDRPVLTLCRSGKRSQQAAELLASAGHEVVNVSGGMLAWHERGLEVVGEQGAGRIA